MGGERVAAEASPLTLLLILAPLGYDSRAKGRVASLQPILPERRGSSSALAHLLYPKSRDQNEGERETDDTEEEENRQYQANHRPDAWEDEPDDCLL